MTEDVASILHALGDHMDRIVEGLRLFGRTGRGWTITEDSLLVEDREGLEKEIGLTGQVAAAADYVSEASLLFLVAQADHLLVLRQIYAGQAGLLFGLGPPARSLLEINGYVFWLLHPDIGHIRTRASQAMLSRLNDAQRHRTAAKALGVPARLLIELGEQQIA